jgi:hypothetical protein
MYLKGAPLQIAHATAFGVAQPKANLWLQWSRRPNGKSG